MFGRNNNGCGCDDFLWIIILLFIICNCCGNNGCDNRPIGGCGC